MILTDTKIILDLHQVHNPSHKKNGQHNPEIFFSPSHLYNNENFEQQGCEKPKYCQLPRSVYVQSLRLWNSWDCEAVLVYK